MSNIKNNMENDNLIHWIYSANNISTRDYWDNPDTPSNNQFLMKVELKKNLAKEYYETNRYECYKKYIEYAKERSFPISGTLIDVGSGFCFYSSELSKIKDVNKIYALDFSSVRLERIAPILFELQGTSKEKIIRVVGDFYDIKLENESIDVVFMAATFHHANDLNRLLIEMNRILKKGGFMFIICETPINAFQGVKAYIGHFIKYFASKCSFLFILEKVTQRKMFVCGELFPKMWKMFPEDESLGDHYYTIEDYKKYINRHGFTSTVQYTGLNWKKEPKIIEYLRRKLPIIFTQFVNIYCKKFEDNK